MEGIGELTFDDYGDDCQASAMEINKKDWCKPLQASMSRLAQMQPSVCNMFLQDAGSLKPPKSMSKPPRQRKQQENTKISSYRDEAENDSIEPSQNSTRSLSRISAWGSNSSIPDLLARQKSQAISRPSSASKLPPRSRPDSAGKCRRPQSAKDTLSEKKENVSASKDLGIRGSKKQVDSRPGILIRSNSDSGLTPKGQNSDLNSLADSAMRNSSTPKLYDSATDGFRVANEMQDNGSEQITETYHGECTEEDELQMDQTRNLAVRASQEEDKSVTPPIPEFIRFSLPNMNDGSDEEGRDEDELDTERLLQQADSFMQKKSRDEQRVLESLADANATIPDTQSPWEQQQATFANSGRYSPDCPISSVAAHNSSSVSFHGKVGNNNSHTDCSNNNISQGQALRSPHVTWSDSHTVRLFQADSPSLFDDGMSHGLKPGAAGNERTESVSTVGRGRRGGGKTGQEGHARTETFKNHNHTFSGSTTSSFLMPDDVNVPYKPLEVTKPCSDRKSSGIKNRPNSGRKESSTKIPENSLMSTYNNAQISNSHIPSTNQSLFQESAVDGQPRKLVPTVTLAYDDENDEDQEQTSSQHRGKKKLKKRKTFDEIETYMSRLDKEEEELIKNNLPSDLANSCACGDVSCSDILASTNQRPETKSGLSLVTAEKTPVVKTTKTIEFCDGSAPAETVTKNTLVAAHEGKPEKVESRQKSDTTSLLRPSMIKRQQAFEDKSKPPKPAGPKKITSAAERISSLSPNLNSATSSPDQKEGGLAPPTEVEQTREEESDRALYETLLEEAKSMALTSMMDAVKQPNPGKRKTGPKPRPPISISAAPEAASSSTIKARPFSAPHKIVSTKPNSRITTPVTSNANSNKHRYCQGHIHKPSSNTGIRRAQSARPERVVSRLDTLITQEDNSPEMYQAQRMQMKMAAMGVQVDASALERALFPPSGKSIYYNVPGDLPRNPTETLIPHYKHWLAEDYHRIKLMERRLARDDEIKYMQKVAAEKKALAQKAVSQKKGKKKKRKEKCVTSAG